MMDENWMRVWVAGHGQLSADIDRLVHKFVAAFDRFAELVTPSHREGADTYFVRVAECCKTICRAATRKRVRTR